jgi:TatD DNase family protein
MQYAFFDIHSHLHDLDFDGDRDFIISEMKRIGVGTITIGTDVEQSKKAIALAGQHENIFASVGLHPNDNKVDDFDMKDYEELARHPKVVAIGECGLDYYRLAPRSYDKSEVGLNENSGERAPRSLGVVEEKIRQKEVFQKQIDLAVKVNKPLMLHGRSSKGTQDAYEDMLIMLEEAKEKHGDKLRGNAHFFAGDIDIAKRFLDIGFTMSFSGVITFAKDYDDVVRYVPIEMMHAETDSPYATPVPFRGQRNNPMYVQEVVAKISVLREQPLEEVRMQLLENAKKMFGV